MKSFQVTFTILILVALAAANAFGGFLPAAPGKSDPLRLRWKGKVITIAISTSLTEPNNNIKTDSDVVGAIRRSIQSWQKVADIEFRIESSENQSVSPAEDVDGTRLSTGDGISLLTIAPTSENVLLFSKDPFSESAKTRVFYNRKNFITEGDIVLSPYQQFSTDGTFGTFDLEATLTHEIGHLLGLRHSRVLGSTMSERLAKNGVFGTGGFEPRTLAENDIASIRDLYGVQGESETCCSSIAGKLTSASTKSFRSLRVWAEDSRSGRLIAETESGFDGSFRLGGLQPGRYSVFWQRDDDGLSSTVGTLGSVRLEIGEVKTLNDKIAKNRPDMVLDFAGINGQLTDSSVSLESGREYLFFLGGKNLDPNRLLIEFNSPFFAVSPDSVSRSNFGQDVSVVSFTLLVHADTPTGLYSIFATSSDGAMSSLIGALNVQ